MTEPEYYRPPLTVRVDKAQSSFNLNGRKMKIRFAIESSEFYNCAGNGKQIIDEICASIEQILEKHALLNQNPPK